MIEKICSVNDFTIFQDEKGIKIVKYGWPFNNNQTKRSSLNRQQAKFLIAQLGEGAAAEKIWNMSR